MAKPKARDVSARQKAHTSRRLGLWLVPQLENLHENRGEPPSRRRGPPSRRRGPPSRRRAPPSRRRAPSSRPRDPLRPLDLKSKHDFPLLGASNLDTSVSGSPPAKSPPAKKQDVRPTPPNRWSSNPLRMNNESARVASNEDTFDMVSVTEDGSVSGSGRSPDHGGSGSHSEKKPAACSTEEELLFDAFNAQGDEDVCKLVDMGFREEDVKHCLERAEGNVDLAVEFLVEPAKKPAPIPAKKKPAPIPAKKPPAVDSDEVSSYEPDGDEDDDDDAFLKTVDSAGLKGKTSGLEKEDEEAMLLIGVGLSPQASLMELIGFLNDKGISTETAIDRSDLIDLLPKVLPPQPSVEAKHSAKTAKHSAKTPRPSQKKAPPPSSQKKAPPPSPVTSQYPFLDGIPAVIPEGSFATQAGGLLKTENDVARPPSAVGSQSYPFLDGIPAVSSVTQAGGLLKTENDVLSIKQTGACTALRQHYGNLVFEAYCESRVDDFIEAQAEGPGAVGKIIDDIVASVINRGGRFLTAQGSSGWVHSSVRDIRDKCGSKLRNLSKNAKKGGKTSPQYSREEIEALKIAHKKFPVDWRKIQEAVPSCSLASLLQNGPKFIQQEIHGAVGKNTLEDTIYRPVGNNKSTTALKGPTKQLFEYTLAAFKLANLTTEEDYLTNTKVRDDIRHYSTTLRFASETARRSAISVCVNRSLMLIPSHLYVKELRQRCKSREDFATVVVTEVDAWYPFGLPTEDVLFLMDFTLKNALTILHNDFYAGRQFGTKLKSILSVDYKRRLYDANNESRKEAYQRRVQKQNEAAALAVQDSPFVCTPEPPQGWDQWLCEYGCSGGYIQHFKDNGLPLPFLYHGLPLAYENIYRHSEDPIGTLYPAALVPEEYLKKIKNTCSDHTWSIYLWANIFLFKVFEFLEKHKGGIITKRLPFCVLILRLNKPDYHSFHQHYFRPTTKVVHKYTATYMKSARKVTFGAILEYTPKEGGVGWNVEKKHDPESIIDETKLAVPSVP